MNDEPGRTQILETMDETSNPPARPRAPSPPHPEEVAESEAEAAAQAACGQSSGSDSSEGDSGSDGEERAKARRAELRASALRAARSKARLPPVSAWSQFPILLRLSPAAADQRLIPVSVNLSFVAPPWCALVPSR